MTSLLTRRLGRLEEDLCIDDFAAWITTLSDDELQNEMLQTCRAMAEAADAPEDVRADARTQIAAYEAGMWPTEAELTRSIERLEKWLAADSAV